LVQGDLAGVLSYLANQSRSAGGREAGIQAARKAFYEGEIAARICDFQAENGGWLTREDMASYRVTIDRPVSVDVMGTTVFSCGPWCQGPLLLQTLAMAESADIAASGHNTVDYIHVLTEIIKLAAADREAFYGDPKFVDVPIDVLLSPDYALQRIALIDAGHAYEGMPPAGLVDDRRGPRAPEPKRQDPEHHDTQYICVVDRWGNAFSATPSDPVMRKAPMVPGTGLIPSARGIQSRIDAKHPASIVPGKRPRLTPNPAIVVRPGAFVMPFGTPGGDLQTQSMAQFFINLMAFGMTPQNAVEAPRFFSYSFPDSFAPHSYWPGLLKIEPGIPDATIVALRDRGHDAQRWPANDWPATSVSAILHDLDRKVLFGAADPRRTAFAMGR
jgi:gamma-glutamyltranspeptidase/glutathione hydrolase